MNAKQAVRDLVEAILTSEEVTVDKAKKLSEMHDPTDGEMKTFLKSQYHSEYDDFDAAEAIYWFANDYHGGMSSNLYSVLSTSQFHPGLISNGPEPEGLSAMMYDDLVHEFGE